MHNPQPPQGPNPHGENPTPLQKEGRTDGQMDGRTDRPPKTMPRQKHGQTDLTLQRTTPQTQYNLTPSYPMTTRPTPRDRMIRQLPEHRTGCCGTFYQGGFAYIYLEKGEQPIRCSDNRPNLKSLFRQISAKGYIVDVDSNPGRLLSDDNGHFKVLLGTRRLTYMITIIEDTPIE